MTQEDKTIEPEVIDEIKENNQNTKKESNTKKVFAWIIMIIAVIYGISPIDIVPDVPAIGWIDDFMIGTAAFTNLVQQQFFQTNVTLNKLFNVAKWILICLAITILLLTVLIIMLIAK